MSRTTKYLFATNAEELHNILTDHYYWRQWYMPRNWGFHIEGYFE